MKIGVFGGSFDPVHHGHLRLAADTRLAFDLERFLFVPAVIPPHKQGRTITSPFHRLAMLSLALRSLDYARIEMIELESGKCMYTVDTLEILSRQQSGEYFLVIGSDNLRIFHTWRNVPRLLELARVVVLERPGSSFSETVGSLPEELKNLCPPRGDRILSFPHEKIEISASDIRDRVPKGQPITGLVPPDVETYIQRYRLYE